MKLGSLIQSELSEKYSVVYVDQQHLEEKVDPFIFSNGVTDLILIHLKNSENKFENFGIYLFVNYFLTTL